MESITQVVMLRREIGIMHSISSVGIVTVVAPLANILPGIFAANKVAGVSGFHDTPDCP